jgi:hypothetical protein
MRSDFIRARLVPDLDMSKIWTSQHSPLTRHSRVNHASLPGQTLCEPFGNPWDNPNRNTTERSRTQRTLSHRYATVTPPLAHRYCFGNRYRSSNRYRAADACGITQAWLQFTTNSDMLVFIVSYEMYEAPTKNARAVHRCVVKEGFHKPGFTLPNRIRK